MKQKTHMLIFSACWIFAVLMSTSLGGLNGPQTYTTCYQNITTDRQETGFIQLIGLAINRTKLIVEADNTTFFQTDTVVFAGLTRAEALNYTPQFNDIRLRQPDPVYINSSQIGNYGVITSSDDPLHLYSIKADKGTTDGYMNLPLTNNSVEFMIVGWPRILDRPFLSTVMAIPALDGTCIELYKIHTGGKYQRISSVFVNKFELFRYFANYSRTDQIDANGNYVEDITTGEDVTGYYLNSSKPVQVIYGHECAWVPTTDNLFCDYIADTMIPINQLGRVYIVPMILGRSASAGYIVRVVPSKDNTEIKYLGNSVVKNLGEFLQFEQPRTDQATVVVCSIPCAVYQYNKGYLSFKDVPTDPYMTMIIPNDRFTAGAPFGTASFCRDVNDLEEFDNYVAIVTYAAYKDQVRFNDEPVSSFSQSGNSVPWTELQVDGDSMFITSFRIRHGFHYVSMAPGEFGSFAVYVYGHSLDPDSSSAYGFSCNYNSTGTPLSKTYAESKEFYKGRDEGLNTDCLNERWLIDFITAGGVNDYVPFPFTLRVGIDPGVQLTPDCLAKYQDQLQKMLVDFARDINYWICVSQNCSYLDGEGVAINYDTLKITFIGSAGVYRAVEVYVELMARYDVRVDYYGSCRAEIMNYMFYFINWPPTYTDYLLSKLDGCPWPINFQDAKFISKPPECPNIF